MFVKHCAGKNDKIGYSTGYEVTPHEQSRRLGGGSRRLH